MSCTYESSVLHFSLIRPTKQRTTVHRHVHESSPPPTPNLPTLSSIKPTQPGPILHHHLTFNLHNVPAPPPPHKILRPQLLPHPRYRIHHSDLLLVALVLIEIALAAAKNKVITPPGPIPGPPPKPQPKPQPKPPGPKPGPPVKPPKKK